MNEPTPDPHDELLRAALRAEAEGVAASETLRRRIGADVDRSSRRPIPWLLAAAVLAVVVGIGVAVLWGDDDDQTVDVVDDRTTTTTTTNGVDVGATFAQLAGRDCAAGTIQLVVLADPSATQGERDAIGGALDTEGLGSLTSVPPEEVLARVQAEGGAPGDVSVEPAPWAWIATFTDAGLELAARGAVSDLSGVRSTSSTDCREELAAPDRPDTIVLVREDGWLVTVDLETGEQRELHTEGDPQRAEPGLEEGGPYFIDAVDLSPDGEWVYFSTCCEPADGMTFRIPTEGGEVEEVGFGAYPRVSPDGRFVATTGSAYLYVRPTDDVGFDAQPALLEIGCCAKHLAWSPDGAELALVFGTGADGETPQIRRFRWDGTALVESDMGKPDNPGWFALWMPDNTLNISAGEPIEDDRGRSQDASYDWILWVDEEGVVKEQAGFETGDVTPIPGLPEALAADW